MSRTTSTRWECDRCRTYIVCDPKDLPPGWGKVRSWLNGDFTVPDPLDLCPTCFDRLGDVLAPVRSVTLNAWADLAGGRTWPR